jgi:hypothetical protein
VEELIKNLNNKNKRIQSDCIKVLYEIGYIKPDMIAGYYKTFLNLLTNKNNRLIWGGMIALSCVAKLKCEDIFPHIDLIKSAMENGSVITYDKGVKTLSDIASCNKRFNKKIFPYLIKILKDARPQSFAQYSESISVALTNENKDEFINLLTEKRKYLNAPRLKRIDKLLKKIK